MRRARSIVLLLILASPGRAAEETYRGQVHLEVAIERGLAVDAQHRWYRLLTKAGVSGLRIRQAEPDDRPRIARQGTPEKPRYHVTAMLVRGERLRMPGATFGANDLSKLKAYLARLAEEGIDGVVSRRGDFGLTARQLEQVHADLAQPVDFPTEGRPMEKMRERIAAQLELPLTVAASAQSRVAQIPPPQEELQGLSSGTVLSFLLRQQGLALRPESTRGKLVHRIFRPEDNAAEAQWPVGWKPEEPEREVLPVLFEFLDVRIENYTLQEVLDALQPRLDVPILVDHARLAKAGVDPQRVVVNFPPKKTYYKRVLNHVLNKARLKGELRIDEAGRPFYWITTLR